MSKEDLIDMEEGALKYFYYEKEIILNELEKAIEENNTDEMIKSRDRLVMIRELIEAKEERLKKLRGN